VYDASVAIHVVAAIIGFGATFTYPVLQVFAARQGLWALPLAMGAILAISQWVAVPATVLVGVTGVYQVVAGPYSFRETWLVAGTALYGFVMVAGVFVLAPAYRRAERLVLRAAESESVELRAEYQRALRLPVLLGPVVAAAIVATAVLMELKPA
jgi:uncharacterized membrane protein